MDASNASPLQGWKLKTTSDHTGKRYHQRASGDECWRSEICIGSGGCGSVWRERCISGPSQMALRAVKHLHRRQLKMSRRELDALITFSDPHTPEVDTDRDQMLGAY